MKKNYIKPSIKTTCTRFELLCSSSDYDHHGNGNDHHDNGNHTGSDNGNKNGWLNDNGNNWSWDD